LFWTTTRLAAQPVAAVNYPTNAYSEIRRIGSDGFRAWIDELYLEVGSGSAISKQLGRQAEALSKGGETASLVEKAEGLLDAKRSARNSKQ